MVVVDKTEDKGKMQRCFSNIERRNTFRIFIYESKMYKVWLELDEGYVRSWRHKKKSCLFFKFPARGLWRVVAARHNFVQKSAE